MPWSFIVDRARNYKPLKDDDRTTHFLRRSRPGLRALPPPETR